MAVYPVGCTALYSVRCYLRNADPEIRKLFEKMRTLSWGKGIAIITAKAAPMTQAEIAAANQPRCIDYIGLLK